MMIRLLMLMVLLFDSGVVLGQTDRSTVTLIALEGPIGPATTDYLVRALADAEAAGHAALVVRLDTPGGLDAATRDINRAILAARIPVIAYVAPEGARAASAGTYILYASHIAAMAPATNLGAATPVPVGGSPGGGASPAPEPEPEPAAGTGEDQAGDDPSPAVLPGPAMTRKVVNDAAAYIRGLAELRGRNADWAERAVREAVSLTASEALAAGVIDLLAPTLSDLLAQADGRTVALHDGQVQLETAGATVVAVTPDWRNRLLAYVSSPTVAYLLFLVGLYGLLLEGYNPGVLVPGIVGAICLILALYAFQVLPINYAGVALIVLGVALMVAEAFAPSFGALGIGGVIALVVGSVILIDTPEMSVPRTLIGGIAAASGLAFLGITLALVRVRRRPPYSGAEALLGAEGRAIAAFTDRGRVHLQGEDWQARTAVPIAAGDRVRVTGKDGLVLAVEPIKGDES